MRTNKQGRMKPSFLVCAYNNLNYFKGFVFVLGGGVVEKKNVTPQFGIHPPGAVVCMNQVFHPTPPRDKYE